MSPLTQTRKAPAAPARPVADPEVPRLTPTQRLHEVTMAALRRQPSVPESSVELGVTAKRLHTWTITVRGADANACAQLARQLDSELSAAFAHELGDNGAEALSAPERPAENADIT